MLEWMMQVNGSYLVTLFVVAWTLFFPPVFIASHTIPLLTELLDEPSKWKAAWAMLFASTVWSFFGSVLTSIVLFDVFGVALSWVLVWSSLLFLAALVYYKYKRNRSIAFVICWVLLISYFTLKSTNSNDVYSFDSAYQHIRVFDAVYKNEDIRIFSLNKSLSSAIYLDKNIERVPFKYINEALMLTEEKKPKNILVIWAAWFTYPQIIASKSYVDKVDTVDIDPKIKEVAEEYFLEEPLDEKITFYPISARGAIQKLLMNNETYDLIFLDAYNDKSVPEELMTIEFFSWIKSLLNPDGVVIANMIMDTDISTDFSLTSLTTMSQELWKLSYKNITSNPTKDFDNFIVTTFPWDSYIPYASKLSKIYTDDRNTVGMDSVKMLYFDSDK